MPNKYVFDFLHGCVFLRKIKILTSASNSARNFGPKKAVLIIKSENADSDNPPYESS